jgi:hypothetical protein
MQFTAIQSQRKKSSHPGSSLHETPNYFSESKKGVKQIT